MDDDGHRRFVTQELFVQAARLGRATDSWEPERVYEALQAAARNGHASIVDGLLADKRLNININGFDQQVLHKAHINLLFFEHTSNESHKTWYFYGEKMLFSPLHLAVKEGHGEVVQKIISFLKRNGALHSNKENDTEMGRKKKEEAGRKWYQGLVEWGVRWGHASIVKQLLPTAPDEAALLPIKDVLLPLHLAIHLGHLEVLKILLQLLPQTKLENMSKQITLYQQDLAAHRLIQQGLPAQLEEIKQQEDLAALRLTKERLIAEIKQQQATHLEKIKQQEDLFSRTKELAHLRQLAAQLEKIKQHQLAAQLAKSLSCFSEDGLTALHLAAQCGCLSVVELLVTTTHMDVNLPSSPELVTSLDTESMTRLDIGKMDVNLPSSPELFTPLHMAASVGHVEVVHFLLQEHGNPSARDCMGRTSLHYAARAGHAAVAQELLKSKLGIESHIASIPDYDGLLPLHMAAKGGHVEVITTLRSYVGGISEKAKQSVEMMRWVECVYMNRDIISTYHSYFSKKWRFPRPMLVDSFFWKTEGFTPLHFAARHGHKSAVRELLQQEMDVGERVRYLLLKDSGGFLAYDWMEVQEQGDAFIQHATEGVHSTQDRLIVEQSLKEGSYVVMNNIGRNNKIAFEIEEEKQALAELYHAWKSGNPELHVYPDWEISGNWEKGNPDLPIRVRILQWLIHSGDYSAFSAFVESLQQGSFAFAKEILCLQPEISRDPRLSKEVVESLKQGRCGVANEILLLQPEFSRDPRLSKDVKEALVESLQQGRFDVAKEIFLLHSEISRDPRLSKEVKEVCISALVDCLKQGQCDVAKEILLLQPEISRDRRVTKGAKGALVESLKQGRFGVASEILSLQPEISRDPRLGKEVKEVLRSSFGMTTPESESLLETFLIELVTTEGLIGASNLLRWLLPWAKEKQLTGLVDVILDQPELKRGLYEDRQVYLDCANAILVGAALIAGVAFQGWLQPPLGYGFEYEGEKYAEVHQRAVRLFWWFNNGAFFLAVGSLIAGAKGAVPVAKETDIVSSLAKVKRAVAVASVLLGAALVCVVGAFTAAGMATLPPLARDLYIMHTSVKGGATICALSLLWFFVSVWPLVVETILYSSNLVAQQFMSKAPVKPLIYMSKALVAEFMFFVKRFVHNLWVRRCAYVCFVCIVLAACILVMSL